MDKTKILTIIVGVISVIGLILFIRVIAAGDDAVAIDSAVNVFIYYATYLLIITSIIAIVLSLSNLIKHPKLLKKSLMSLGILAVLLLLAYFVSSGDAVTDSFGKVIKNGEAGTMSKWISTLINFTGILGTIGIIAIAGGFLKSLFK